MPDPGHTFIVTCDPLNDPFCQVCHEASEVYRRRWKNRA